MEYPGYSETKNHAWTLIILFFCNSSVAEMMIGVMMNVIWTWTTCMNMMNIHILKS